MNFRKSIGGFSIIETLVVLSFLVLIVAVVTPRLGDFRENQVIRSSVSEVATSIEKARHQSLSGLGDTAYGVHLSEDEVVIFEGTSYSAGDPDNKSISILEPAQITNIVFSGGVTSFYFDRLTGIPSATGSFDIEIEGGDYRTLDITDVGLVEITIP